MARLATEQSETNNSITARSREEDVMQTNPLQPPPPRTHFNTSDLYSPEIIDALLARHPPSAKQARKSLLAAKVYLEGPKIDRHSAPCAILDLCDARLELVSCYLHDHEQTLAESEALQVVAACKKISNNPRYRVDGETRFPQEGDKEIAARCLRTYIDALGILHDIDEERGIPLRAARWRDTRSRLGQRLNVLKSQRNIVAD